MDIYLNVHMISDSTGETLNTVMRAACAQFDKVAPVGHTYFLVRTPERLNSVMKQVSKYPGIVFYTVLETSLRVELEEKCSRMGYPALPVIDRAVRIIGSYIGRESDKRVAGQHVLDEDYFRRMDAIHFVLTHDDGMGRDTLHEADVLLLGVSRTSKTPTCVYLGNRGVRAANVPLVPGISFSFDKSRKSRPLIVGLKMTPERLVQIRKARVRSMGDHCDTAYADQQKVREEIIEANRLFAQNDWPVIDVTRRSVEETAAVIMNLLNTL